MKIALLTIHRSANYGAVLQAYTTKKILSKYGEVSIIDYDNRFLAHHIDLIRFEPTKRGMLMLAHDLLRLPYRISTVKKFRRFFSDNFNLTPKLTAEELMAGKADNFDVYVCGSDQIWNPEIVSAEKCIDPIFFLSFAPEGSKKLSYASSTGHHHYTNTEKKDVKELLQDFSMISTRESDGVEKLKEILPDREIQHVLDPTLLLSKEEWLESLEINSTEPKEKYILVYSVPRTELIKKAVEYFAKKLNMKVVAIDQMLFPLTQVDEHVRDAGPKEFVELFANASFVITDSFHGTCFAVNFGKPFVSVSAGKRTNRIISLLSLLDIDERLVNDVTEFENIKPEINSKIILEKLNSARKDSLGLLVNNLDSK